MEKRNKCDTGHLISFIDVDVYVDRYIDRYRCCIFLNYDKPHKFFDDDDDDDIDQNI